MTCDQRALLCRRREWRSKIRSRTEDHGKTEHDFDQNGYYYVTKKNPRTQTEKLEMRKYDPVVRKHVVFKEGRIK